MKHRFLSQLSTLILIVPLVSFGLTQDGQRVQSGLIEPGEFFSTELTTQPVSDDQGRYGTITTLDGPDISYRIGGSNQDPVGRMTSAIPDSWRVLPGQEPRYEIAIISSITELERCAYQGLEQEFTLIRRQMELHVSIIDLQTNEQIDARLFSSTSPRECGRREQFSSQIAYLIGDFNVDEFEPWLFSVLATRITFPGMRFMLADVEAAHYFNDVQYSPDGQTILVANGQNVIAYDAGSGEELLRFSHHKSNVVDADYSPDGAFAVSGSIDGEAWIWDVSTGEVVTQLEVIPDSSLAGIKYSLDGQSISAISNDVGLRSWEIETGKLMFQKMLGYNNFTYSPDGTQIAIVERDIPPRIFSTMTGELLYELRSNIKRVFGIIYSDDGKFIVPIPGTRGPNSNLEIWDSSSGERQIQVENYSFSVTNYPTSHLVADFSMNNEKIIISSESRGIQLWNINRRNEETLPDIFDTLSSDSAIISPDGAMVVTLESLPREGIEGRFQVARLRDIRTGEILLDLGGYDIRDIIFSPNGESVLISSGQIITVWNTNHSSTGG